MTILVTTEVQATHIRYAAGLGIELLSIPFIEKVNLDKQQQIARFIQSHPKTKVIITSTAAIPAVQNAQAILGQSSFYVVGKKAFDKLTQMGMQVIGQAGNNAAALATQIIADNPCTLLYLCSSRRRDELPERMINAGIDYNEIVVYETQLKPTKVDKLEFDGLFFLSPSAVEAFFHSNVIPSSKLVVAIGNTTAEALKNQGIKDILVAENTAIESMLDLVAAR